MSPFSSALAPSSPAISPLAVAVPPLAVPSPAVPLSRRPLSLPHSSLSQHPTSQMSLPVNGAVDQRMDFVVAKLVELNTKLTELNTKLTELNKSVANSITKIAVQLRYLNAGVATWMVFTRVDQQKFQRNLALWLNRESANVKLLLDKGARVNFQNGIFGTALCGAAAHGHTAIVEQLLSKGAEVDAGGGCYSNASQAAFSNGHHEIVSLLQREPLNGLDNSAPSNAEMNIDEPGDRNMVDDEKARGDEDILFENLLDYDSDSSSIFEFPTISREKDPPEIYGQKICQAVENRDPRTLQWKLREDNGLNAEPEAAQIKQKYYNDAFLVALENKDVPIATILLEKGIQVRLQDKRYAETLFEAKLLVENIARYGISEGLFTIVEKYRPDIDQEEFPKSYIPPSYIYARNPQNEGQQSARDNVWSDILGFAMSHESMNNFAKLLVNKGIGIDLSANLGLISRALPNNRDATLEILRKISNLFGINEKYRSLANLLDSDLDSKEDLYFSMLRASVRSGYTDEEIQFFEFLLVLGAQIGLGIAEDQLLTSRPNFKYSQVLAIAWESRRHEHAKILRQRGATPRIEMVEEQFRFCYEYIGAPRQGAGPDGNCSCGRLRRSRWFRTRTQTSEREFEGQQETLQAFPTTDMVSAVGRGLLFIAGYRY
ncbi:hypothetical protein TWF281_002428 [Arthrobotrys megalospora]